MNKVDVFIANSKYTLNLAKKHYGLQKVKSNVILNGINIENSENVNPLLNNEYFTIGLVTRFINRINMPFIIHFNIDFNIENLTRSGNRVARSRYPNRIFVALCKNKANKKRYIN